MKSIDQQLLFLVFWAFLLMGSTPAWASEVDQDVYFQERANLALREVAHRMLLINGDSTTPVPPVHSKDGLQFMVRFPGELRYDTLRAIIDETLEAAGLPLRYDLAIYDCLNEALILGFVARLQTQNNGESYPCQERDPITNCVDLAIRFPGQSNQFTANAGWLGGIGMLLGLFVLGWWRWQQTEQLSPVQVMNDSKAPSFVQIGTSLFNPQEQKIVIGKEEKKLTYRETKLLQYFCQNANKVLPREQIVDAVWGEEGVQVTRSLDMFVSRLRKILKPDSLIQISSIHGVGYRMVV